MPDISIIVPCYNAGKYLAKCVESLLAQSTPADIILVNDGSTDDTLAIAASFAEKYSNFFVLSSENRGVSQARKLGLEFARGRYVGFVDADDWVEPGMYDRLYRALVHVKADIAASGMYLSDENGRDIPRKQRLKTGTVLTSGEALHHLHCRRDVFPFMWNKLYRRELFDGVVFPTENLIGEDYLVQIQLLSKAERIVTVNEPLYHYVQRDASMSMDGFCSRHSLSYRYYRKAGQQLISADPGLARDVSCYLSLEFMAFVIAMCRNRNYDYEILKEIRDYIRSHLKDILLNKDHSLFYKGCAAVFAIHYKLLTGTYRIIGKR